MNFRTAVKRLVETTGYTINKLPDREIVPQQIGVYDQDGLRSVHNHEFMNDLSFRKAYRRGALAASDYGWHWRVHIGLWVAFSASKLDGDFVECGVNRGFLSSAIMQYLNWDSLGKIFYLLDTFAGLDERFVSEQELKTGAMEDNEEHLRNGFYVRGADVVRANFSQWNNLRIVEGSVPDTLSSVDTRKIAYLHLDMNCAPPEVAAFNYLWESLVPGAFILLDDYAYQGFGAQKAAMDAAACAKDLKIASLPTGQGLLIKPSLIANQIL
jgi:macrocin-O-methyltransferase TylF-like protien